MADKTPVRVVYNSSNVATGLAEFQSTETVGYAFGGTGLSSLGTAGQVLKVNAAGTAMEFGAEGDISITNLVAPSNSDLTLTTSGTGNIVLDGITVRGTTLSAADSSAININEGLIVDGTASVSGALSSATSLALATGATVTGILDEDGMGTNSATQLATQQSIKAYVDATVTAQDLDFQGDSGGALNIDLDSETLDIAGGTGIDTSGSSNTLTVAIDSTVTTLTGTQVLTNKTLTAPTITATSTTVGGKIKFLEGTDNGTNGVTLVGAAATADVDVILPASADTLVGKATTDTLTNKSIDLANNTLTGSLAEWNSALQSDSFVSLTGSETVTNKTLTSPVLNTGVSGTAILDEDAMGTNSATQLATQQSIKAYADTKAVLTGTTNNTITTVTGAHAFQGEANLTFDGTDMLVASSGKVKFTDANESVHSDGTNLILTSGGSAYKIPVSDGDDGQALITDGAGTLSFGTVGAASASDDSLGVGVANKIITSTARTIDSFHATFQDSAFYMVVSNDHSEDCVNVQAVSLCHNNTTAFVSSSGVISKAAGTDMTAFTADISNDMVRLKAASTNAVGGRASYYKFGLGDNSSAATSGNVIVTVNADVDSASESLVSFAHGTYRGAKLFISINNDSKTEVGNIEALVVHDGSTGYITTYNQVSSGNNDLIALTGAIDGSNFVVSAEGYEPNLRVTVHAIMLKDTMVTDAGTYANTEAIAPVTVSSTATEVDTLIETTNNGAMYYFVSKNASEGTYAVNEVFVALGSGECAIANAGYVSTKGTNQLTFTSDYKDDVEATASILAASTSGGSTTVSAYRLNALAK